MNYVGREREREREHGLIGPGIDASHAMERAHVDGIAATIQLLVAYMCSE